jgi:hypothetical protein
VIDDPILRHMLEDFAGRRRFRRKLARRLPRRERIGPPECPLMDRWTLFLRNSNWPKLLLHHFLPNREDKDVHDHPRGFLTVVFAGGYDDLVACPSPHAPWPMSGCALCIDNDGLVVRDRLRVGSVRLRRADYAHLTRTDHRGAWTLCLMFPVTRSWGFWRDGRWWPFREYEQRFGMAMRCDDAPPVHYRWDGTGAGEAG